MSTNEELEELDIDTTTSLAALREPLPRVGGVFGGTVWTGGSGLRGKRLQRPKTIFTRRPTDFRGASKIEETSIRGLPEGKRLGLEKGEVSLTSWIRLIRIFLEDTGQDSVFRIADDREETEIYLLEDWGRATVTTVEPWVASLQDGTAAGGTACPYDVDNLRWSGKAILSSITQDLWIRIEKELPVAHETTGPHALAAVVSHMQQINASSVRQLVKQLEALSLKKESEQNVLTFGDRVLELTRRIDGTGMAPRDLNLLVAARFLNADNFQFCIEATRIHREADQDPGSAHYEAIITAHKAHYRSLVAQDLWSPKTAENSKNTESELAGLRAEVKRLTAVVSGKKNNSINNKANDRKNGTCFRCHKRGHTRSNCPENLQGGSSGQVNTSGQVSGRNNNKPWWRTPPDNGQPEELEKHGKLHKWCKHCKRWTFGEFLHSSSEHQSRGNTQANSGQSGGSNGASGGQNNSSGGSGGQSAGTANLAQEGRNFGGLVQCGNLYRRATLVGSSLESYKPVIDHKITHKVNLDYPCIYEVCPGEEERVDNGLSDGENGGFCGGIGVEREVKDLGSLHNAVPSLKAHSRHQN